MESKVENGVLTVILPERVETTNAEQFGQDFSEIRSKSDAGTIVLDADNLAYISSAGLRQILKIRKSCANLSIVNVSSEIYEIFDMTGFTDMIDIQKAYRKFSVDGCEVIGEGSNGIVYRINDDTIIKVYKNNDALEDIKRERELARKALVMGVNTAIPYDVVKVGEHYGSVFEMLSSKSITKWIKSDPDNKDEYIKVFADMLKDIHETHVSDGSLPSEKQVVLKWAQFLADHIDSAHYEKLISLIENVPETDTMIHGDYHTGNLHYDKKEAILIDMDTIAVGNPVFEFGSIRNAFLGSYNLNPAEVVDFLGLDIDTTKYIWNKLLEYYIGSDDPKKNKELDLKASIVGLTRALRRTIKRMPDEKELIERTKNELLAAIDQIDNLAY